MLLPNLSLSSQTLSGSVSVILIFQLARPISLWPKTCGRSALAPLRKIGQVASAAGYGNRQAQPMFLRLKIEPRKTTCLDFCR